LASHLPKNYTITSACIAIFISQYRKNMIYFNYLSYFYNILLYKITILLIFLF